MKLTLKVWRQKNEISAQFTERSESKLFARISSQKREALSGIQNWIPACAGMTRLKI